MIRGALRLVLACVCAGGLAAAADAQTGHPAKGSWLGYWGPKGGEQRRIFLLLDWKNRALAGVVNPGPNASPITKADIDYDTWTMTLEADLPKPAGGGKAHWVAKGALENLGSWKNRRYSGTYTYGSETGEFSVTLN
jgi:hypothetical protein